MLDLFSSVMNRGCTVTAGKLHCRLELRMFTFTFCEVEHEDISLIITHYASHILGVGPRAPTKHAQGQIRCLCIVFNNRCTRPQPTCDI